MPNSDGHTFGNGHDIHIANYGPQNNSSYINGMAYPLESQYALNKGIKKFHSKKLRSLPNYISRII